MVGLVSTVVGGYAGGLSKATSANLTKTANPQTVLARDRAAFRSSCLALGLTIGLSAGLVITFSLKGDSGVPNGFGDGLSAGLTILVAVGLPYWLSTGILGVVHLNSMVAGSVTSATVATDGVPC